MKYTACNLCGSEDSRELYPATLPDPAAFAVETAFLCTSPDYGLHHRIVQCRCCGFVYANPRNVEADVIKAYETVEDPLYLRERAGREITFRKHLAAMRRYTGAPNGRRLLDVGAYIGIFVEAARAAGWEAEGVEPSSWAVRLAREAGLPVRPGTLAANNFPPASFDVITLWDVIEHFGDPRAELDRIFRLLKPGGVVVIHTMDVESFPARLMGRRWPFLMEMHVVFFSRATLREMLRRAGFDYLGDHTQGRYLRLGYLAGRVTAAAGPIIGRPLEGLVSALGIGGLPVPINTFDLFTAYARKPLHAPSR